ncbi:MAG: HvfB family MNIO-type RiPP peptide maturase [Halothiobacillus sp.]
MQHPLAALPIDVGIGLRRGSLMHEIETELPALNFLEVAPENWLRLGGAVKRRFEALIAQYPLYTHGLSLSIGGPAPLDFAFIGAIKQFLDRYQPVLYSEHLSFCSDNAHLYDLMPIPFTEAAIDHVVDRIIQVQDRLGQRLVLENVSYYTAPTAELSEIDFITTILARADCDLLLDVNNVYVNSVNHQYDPRAFIDAMPCERVRYLHVAGHLQLEPDLIIDTHGAPISDPVWDLLAHTYQRLGPVPTLLERDFEIPPLRELLAEVAQIRAIAERAHSGIQTTTPMACLA